MFLCQNNIHRNAVRCDTVVQRALLILFFLQKIKYKDDNFEDIKFQGLAEMQFTAFSSDTNANAKNLSNSNANAVNVPTANVCKTRYT